MNPFSFDTTAYTETFSQPSNYTFTDSDFTGAYGQLGAYDVLKDGPTLIGDRGVGTGGLTGRVGQQKPAEESDKPLSIGQYLEAFGIPFLKNFGSNLGTGLAMKLFPGLQGQATPYKPMEMKVDKEGNLVIAGQRKTAEQLKEIRDRRRELRGKVTEGDLTGTADGMFISDKPEIEILNAGEKAYQGMRA